MSAKEKPVMKPFGPNPDYLIVEGDWKHARGKAPKKKRPKEERPESKKGRQS